MSRFFSIAFFIVVLAVILLGGFRQELLPAPLDRQDWLHHTLVFALLVFSARLAFPRTLVFWTVLYCLLLAVFIELAQGILPKQSLSFVDMAANMGGVLLGLAAALLWKRQLILRQASGDY